MFNAENALKLYNLPALFCTKNVLIQKWHNNFLDDFCVSSTFISPDTINGELLKSKINEFCASSVQVFSRYKIKTNISYS